MILGECTFVLGQVRPAFHDQALGIHQPATLAPLRLRHARLHHGRDKELGDADVGLPGAEEEHALVRQSPPGQALCRIQPGEAHGAGALDVVVECAQPVPVV